MPDTTRALLCLLVAALAAPLLSPAAAQESGIEDQIRSLGADNGRLYARPVTSGLGAGLAAGWFHDARSLGPLSVEVGVRGVGAFVPGEDESFEPVLPSEISVDELGERTFSDPYGTGDGLQTPTAAGEGAGIVVPPEGEFRQALIDAGLSPADFALRFPRGFDFPAVPAGALQLNVGVAPGVDVSGRFVPEIEVDEEIGSVQSVGGAVKLSVTDWMYVSTPVDVAVAAGIQAVDVGDYLSTDTRHATLLVSRSISDLTLFASGTLEDSDSEVEYTVESEVLPEAGTTVTFEDDGANSGRFTAGFSLDLLFLQLKADYSVSQYETVSAGVGVRF